VSFHITEATQSQLSSWDTFVRHSCNGTLFQRRDFLLYHGSKFDHGQRYLVISKGDSPVALISVHIDSLGSVKSPYGGSYGGFVFKSPPSLNLSRTCISLFLDWCRINSAISIRITPTPAFCSRQSTDTFLYALLQSGFIAICRDISSVVELTCVTSSINNYISGKTRNIIRSARSKGITVIHNADLDDVWPLLQATYIRHKATPAHSYADLLYLTHCLPDNIHLSLARKDSTNLAAIVEFTVNSLVQSSFYFCRSDVPSQGLSLLVVDALERALARKYKFYDFGTSTVNSHSRDSVFSFKEGFGASGYFRDTYEYLLSY
jgi:hypothetical protein